MKVQRRFSQGEEIANAISHGLGAIFGIVSLILLVIFSAKYATAWHVVSFSIYGTTLTVLYLSSTFNHSLKAGKAKDFFHNFDQVAIYLLIAGTYTPIALVVLKGDWGWVMFGIQWGLAATGIVLKLFFTNTFEKGVAIFFILSYILMGWLLLFFLIPLFKHMPVMGMMFIFIGGACYTLGTVFFKLEKKINYSHLIWHLFVIAGSVMHFIAIFKYAIKINLQ
ncbi:MAG: hemolysin III family protein [Bacteroidales bacterium]|nr:hemolysin III family protein [Bacteroidales bacterium]